MKVKRPSLRSIIEHIECWRCRASLATIAATPDVSFMELRFGCGCGAQMSGPLPEQELRS